MKDSLHIGAFLLQLFVHQCGFRSSANKIIHLLVYNVGLQFCCGLHFFSSTQAEESNASVVKSRWPVTHNFVSRLRCLENSLLWCRSTFFFNFNAIFCFKLLLRVCNRTIHWFECCWLYKSYGRKEETEWCTNWTCYYLHLSVEGLQPTGR
jgi:hypothetical protein